MYLFFIHEDLPCLNLFFQFFSKFFGMPHEHGDKDYEDFKRFFVSTAVLMGANNDNETLRAMNEVLKLDNTFYYVRFRSC